MKALHTFKYFGYIVEITENDKSSYLQILYDDVLLFEDDNFTSKDVAINYAKKWVDSEVINGHF